MFTLINLFVEIAKKIPAFGLSFSARSSIFRLRKPRLYEWFYVHLDFVLSPKFN